MISQRRRNKRHADKRPSYKMIPDEVREVRIKESETIEIAGVVRADRVVAREILLMDKTNHRRAVFYADNERTIITIHDRSGRKRMSLVAAGDDEPTIDIYKHDEIAEGQHDSGSPESVRLYSYPSQA